VTATPGQAARDLQAGREHAEWTGWAEANGYGNEHARDYGHDDMRDAFTAGMHAERDLAAQEPHAAPELGTAWRLLNEARATLAVTQAERDDLATQLDKLRSQHRELLGMFHGTDSGQSLRLSGVRLTRMYASAGMPVPDRLSHLARQ
jgi:hypothetical protein